MTTVFSIYLVTNSVNGHRYIGVTGKAPNRRLRDHFSASQNLKYQGRFYRAIRRHGRENFSIQTLLTCGDRESAFACEITMIAEAKPEYNSTLGGEGQLGRKMSEDGRERCGRANRGKRHRLGSTHTPEVKEILRDLGHKNKSKWAKYAHMGPKKQARAVICVNDGKIFKSASAAAEHYDVDKGALTEVCNQKRGRASLAGFVFRYVGEHLNVDADAARAAAKRNQAMAAKKLQKSLICVSDGMEFDCALDAHRHYGIPRSSITQVACGYRKSTHGLIFKYAA